MRRILLMIPTLFAIILVNFVIVQAAPGGPVEQLIAQLKGTDTGALGRISGGGGEVRSSTTSGQDQTRGARGLDPTFIPQLNNLYGFDKPPTKRFSLIIPNHPPFPFPPP